MKLILTALLVTLAIGFNAQAEDALSLTPQETYDLVQEQGDRLLFVDVRDPIEIMFIGFTDMVDKNIPFKLADRSDFLSDKGRFAMNTNRDFASQIEEALREKGLTRDDLVITMCRSGSSRGKRIVNGWQNEGLPWSMTLNPEKIYRP